MSLTPREFHEQHLKTRYEHKSLDQYLLEWRIFEQSLCQHEWRLCDELLGLDTVYECHKCLKINGDM